MKNNILRNSVLVNLNLLLILKNIVTLLFIGLIFFFSVSSFSKKNKVIEGNWFESDASKARRARRLREQAIENMRLRQACLFPTAANYRACGDRYYFPEQHSTAAANTAEQIFRKKINNSKKPDVALTSRLNDNLNRY